MHRSDDDIETFSRRIRAAAIDYVESNNSNSTSQRRTFEQNTPVSSEAIPNPGMSSMELKPLASTSKIAGIVDAKTDDINRSINAIVESNPLGASNVASNSDPIDDRDPIQFETHCATTTPSVFTLETAQTTSKPNSDNESARIREIQPVIESSDSDSDEDKLVIESMEIIETITTVTSANEDIPEEIDAESSPKRSCKETSDSSEHGSDEGESDKETESPCWSKTRGLKYKPKVKGKKNSRFWNSFPKSNSMTFFYFPFSTPIQTLTASTMSIDAHIPIYIDLSVVYQSMHYNRSALNLVSIQSMIPLLFNSFTGHWPGLH